MINEQSADDDKVISSETVAQTCSIDYFCEVCGFYPLIPMHGHFECPECHYKTKCCEGA